MADVIKTNKNMHILYNYLYNTFFQDPNLVLK